MYTLLFQEVRDSLDPHAEKCRDLPLVTVTLVTAVEPILHEVFHLCRTGEGERDGRLGEDFVSDPVRRERRAVVRTGWYTLRKEREESIG
jgi:hypothetical protein